MGLTSALDELRQGLPGIEIDTSIFRSNTFIETAVHNLGMALAVGGLLLIVALGAWFLSWRAALISIVAIALSLVTAGLVLSLRNAPVNIMVVAGLVAALAAVIDDVVTQVDNILRRLRQYRSQDGDRSAAAIIFEACAELHSPLVYATLITVLAVTPVLLLGGSAGAFFGPFAVSYMLALLASMAVALTVTPALALLLLRGAPLDHRELSACAVAPGSLRQDCCANRWRPTPDVPRRRPCRAGRSRRVAPAKLVAASLVQRA